MIERNSRDTRCSINAYIQGEFVGSRMPIVADQSGKLTEKQLDTIKFHNPRHWLFTTVLTGRADMTDPFQWGYAKEDKDRRLPADKHRIVHDIYGRKIPVFIRPIVSFYRKNEIRSRKDIELFI